MALTIFIICISLFFLAFLGLNKLGATLWGLAAAIGMLFGIYFVWIGLTRNNGTLFIWGCILLLVTGCTLICLKTGYSD